jgi:hypothetical protein
VARNALRVSRFCIGAAMGTISSPHPVKLFCGVLTRFEDLFPEIKRGLEDSFGTADAESDTLNFDFTNYYEKTMGAGLLRKFYSFHDLLAPDRIVEAKIRTNEIEAEFARQYACGTAAPGCARPINLDPGYVTLSKLTLASTKDYSHRVYLRKGIYVEVTLKFQDGRFVPWPWTYPDYKTPGYHKFFLLVREVYAEQLRTLTTRYA